MTPKTKNIVSFIIAFVIGLAVVFAIENLGHLIYPPPIDINSREDLQAYIGVAPLGSFAFVLLAHILGPFVTGFFIGKYSGNNSRRLSLVASIIWTLFGVINLILIKHPMWFVISDLCIFYPMTILGWRLGSKL